MLKWSIKINNYNSNNDHSNNKYINHKNNITIMSDILAALLLLLVPLRHITLIIIIIIIQNFIHRFKKIDYLQIQEYEY